MPSEELRSKIYELIDKNDASSLRQILNEQQEGGLDERALNIMKVENASKQTALAFAASKNSEECFFLVFNHGVQKNVPKSLSFSERHSLVAHWLN